MNPFGWIYQIILEKQLLLSDHNLQKAAHNLKVRQVRF